MRTRRGLIGIFFLLFGAVLIYGVLFMGAPVGQATMDDRRHRDLFLLAVGLLGFAGGVAGWRPVARSVIPLGASRQTLEDRILLAAAVGLPCYALLQFIPLPVVLVGLFSPARGALLRALEPIVGHRAFASLSIVPAVTFTHFLLFTSYCIIFFVAREFAMRVRNVWAVTAPVVLAAVLEAIFGLMQYSGGAAVVGTYTIRNHLAGLLEMALPLAAMYSIAIFRDVSRRDAEGASAMVRAVAGSMVTGLLLAGAVLTLSRGGYCSILASALAIAAFTITRGMSKKKRLAIACLIFACGAVSVFFLTPMEMLGRFSEHTSAGRVAVWRDVPGVIAEYPVFGCGLGGFESAFLKFKTSAPVQIVDYAHNDYLQLLAELGIAGFAIGVMLLGLVVVRVARMAAGPPDERWIGLAVLGSLAAILTHSAFDFNLYVPANAAVLAWICGLGASLMPSDSHGDGDIRVVLTGVERRPDTWASHG